MAQNSGKQRQKNVIGDPKNHMWAEACTLLKQAEQLHRQFFEPARGGTRTARWEPPVDVFETERQVWIIAALPGVAPEAGCVEGEGERALLVGTPPLPSAGTNGGILGLWMPYGGFERRIKLSPELRLAERELMHGCLVLTFTKLG